MIYTVLIFTLAALIVIWGVVDVIMQTKDNE
jgi:hypothetical protein